MVDTNGLYNTLGTFRIVLHRNIVVLSSAPTCVQSYRVLLRLLLLYSPFMRMHLMFRGPGGKPGS